MTDLCVLCCIRIIESTTPKDSENTSPAIDANKNCATIQSDDIIAPETIELFNNALQNPLNPQQQQSLISTFKGKSDILLSFHATPQMVRESLSLTSNLIPPCDQFC